MNIQQNKKLAPTGLLKVTSASLRALPILALLGTQSAVADWVDVDGQWTLSTPLVGNSTAVPSFGIADFEVFSGESASILSGASWTGIQLQDPLVIAFEQYSVLELGGDLTATTAYQSLDDAFLSGAVGFFNGGVLAGEGNISITSNSATTVAPLVLAGVYSNDVGFVSIPNDAIEGEPAPILGEPGTLDITNYTGDITVTNDNSLGVAAVSEDDSIFIPILGELDLSKSAVAIGLGAVESDSGLGLGEVSGQLNQTITTTAKSRNAEFVEEPIDDFEDDAIEADVAAQVYPAVTAAVAAGTLGDFTDGIASTAVINTTANSGTTNVASFSDLEGGATAVGLGLAVGVGGVVDGIENGATITTTATSGSSTTTAADFEETPDGPVLTGNSDAAAFNVAVAAGIVGVVNAIEEIPDGDEAPALTTSIATTATSAQSTALGGNIALAGSGALAVGVGGLIEDLSDTELTTVATSDVVNATAEGFATGLSLSGAVGVIGFGETEMEQTTLTSTATSAAATATGDFAPASAVSLAVAGGALGEFNSESADLTLASTASSAASTSTSGEFASADSSALAFGVSSGEVIIFLAESFGGLLNQGGLPIGGILDGGMFVPDLVSPDFSEPAAIQADELSDYGSFGFNIDGTIIATAADATATRELEEAFGADAIEGDSYGPEAVATANAAAVGFDTAIGFSDFEKDAIEGEETLPSFGSVNGSMTATATAGNAVVNSSSSGYSSADAYAQGFEEVEGDLNATVDVTADAGTASTYLSAYREGSSEATAQANALGVEELGGDLGLDASVTVKAMGGTSTVEQSPSDDLFPEDIDFTTSTASADSSSYATGIESVSGEEFLPDGIESDPFFGLPQIDGAVTVTASSESAKADGSTTYAYSRADSVAVGIGSVNNSDSIAADLLGTIDVDATGGEADASGEIDADAQTSAYATAVVTGDFHVGEIGGTITADSVGGDASADSFEAASANAFTEAVGVFVKSSEICSDSDDHSSASASIDSDVTASITANATADAASAVSEGFILQGDAVSIEGFDIGETLVIAQAEAAAYGIQNVNTIYGDVSGPITANASGGSSYAQARNFRAMKVINEPETVVDDFSTQGASLLDYEVVALSNSESVGIEGSVDGVLSSDINLTAGQGLLIPVAEAYNDIGGIAIAEATSTTIGVDGDVYGDIGGEFDGDVAAISGTFTQTATGGFAVAEVDTYEDEIDIWIPDDEPDAIEADLEVIDVAYTVSADASAESIGIDGNVLGDASADFNIAANGGSALASSSDSLDSREALASGDAAGIYGSVTGNYNATMLVTATGGDAYLEYTGPVAVTVQSDSPTLSEVQFADASATATGIGGANELAIDGDIAGSITVSATGGRVASFDIEDSGNYIPNMMLTDTVIESGLVDFEESAGLDLREASYNASAQAVGVNGSVISESVSAAITATAVGGFYGISSSGQGLVWPVEILNTVQDTQIGPDYSLGGFAAGIAGESVVIGELTGDITATATGGYVSSGLIFITPRNDNPEFDPTQDLPVFPDFPLGFASEFGYAFAAGIMTYSPLAGDYSDSIESVEPASAVLDVTIASSVSAIAGSPLVPLIGDDSIEGEESALLYNPYAYAAAVYGAQGDDVVQLADGADILGDINLGGGLNSLSVIGNTIMEGNILSSANSSVDFILNIDNGLGTVDFDIDEGFFTAVRTVYVSDLTDVLTVEAAGGLAPILNQSDEDYNNSVIDVSFGQQGASAAVEFASGATVLPVFDESVDLNNLVGNKYLLVSSEEGITDNGAVVDNTESPFEYVLEVRDNLNVPADAIEGVDTVSIAPVGQDLFLVVDGVKTQDEEETPGTVQTNQAVNASSQAVLVDISKHAAILRTLLRSNTQGSIPTGPSGPDAERMQKGEWLSYVSVFGNIGEQESSGGFAGYEYDTYGFVFGQEKLLGEQLIVGIAGGYAQTDIDGLDNSGGGDSDLYSVVAYANWFTDTWYGEAGLTYGHAESDVVRIDFKDDAYTGDYDSDLFGGWLEFGYTTEYEGFGVEPYARATYVHGEHDGFTDEGPDALVMTTDDTETDNFKTELGLRVNEQWSFENDQSFLLEVKAAWQREWGDEGVTVDASYLGDDTLTLDSAEADEDALVLGIRGEWRNGKGLSLGLEYEPTFSGNWYNHSFSGTVQYNW